MYSKILVACIALLATTVIYTSLLYNADKTDGKLVSAKIQAAFSDGELLINLFPPSSAVWARDNLSGIDQSVESFYALMVLYKDHANPWMNALNPGYYQAVDDGIPQTEQAHLCAFASKESLDDPAVWEVAHKPRFWHGVKAIVLSAFKYLELSQIHWMIKISTFFAFALLALQVMFLDRKVGLAYTAFTLSAFYCSSIFFFGGVAYSVPLLSIALWGAVWLGFRMLPCHNNRIIEIFIITLGGTIFSFFFQLGGCEIYAMSLIVFVEIFVPTEKSSIRSLQKVFESCVYYLIGFFGSIILKHVLIVCLSGSFDVFVELINKIALRTSNTNNFGTTIGFIDIINAQFYWYGVASYGVDTIYQFVNASKYLSFIPIAVVPFWLAMLKFFEQKTEFEELFVAFCGYVLMLATVVLRYMLLRNHSDIHVFFVDRYLFVFAGTVYFFFLWLLIFSNHLLPRRFKKIEEPT
jgi:hypothetical protein